jgi:hypothetical protein
MEVIPHPFLHAFCRACFDPVLATVALVKDRLQHCMASIEAKMNGISSVLRV